ncbi:chitin deacetylase 1-like [Eriocheir sinensis]|uniref:chitin deacetylase 1-like n=1 Tax=Eriocheir sinensis TaxID=95602 RepID=UPI0021C82467|nr:chitin deacetylase 1-like [Eriocheir sinensis]QVG59410.1 chitin deacetylase 1 [Eriocheir sinensis]
MTRLRVAVVLGLLGIVVAQELDAQAEDFTKALCAEKGPGEWFRLAVTDCRDVIQCTEAGLQALRCPHGLAFDLELQTCDWKGNVKNCDKKIKTKKAKPLFQTSEPLCQENQLACGDGTCMEQHLFCDGKEDCSDGSDENACDVDSDPNRAPLCNQEECILPDCYCYHNGNEIPKDMLAKDVPQMVTITFDDAVNNNNNDLYQLIFDGRVNPNGCNIKSTFFVSHKYTNYTSVQELHRQGHEVAVHSISHNASEEFWSHASEDEWEREMAGARVIVDRFANITDNSVIGLRAPYLRVGGNNQFRMMETNAFLYDSTITAPLQNPPLWPYTLYYRMPHVCHGNAQSCPTRSFAVWEMVMNELDRREDPAIEAELPGCAMVDSCFSSKPTADRFYNFLVNNFNRHYLANRAPLGLFFHSAFLKNDPEILDAFLFWLDETLANYNDVYFVTMTQVIQWMQDPNPVNQLNNYEPWREKCVIQGQPYCVGGTNCELNTEELPGETLRLSTCMRCPNKYPWLKDPLGEGFF